MQQFNYIAELFVLGGIGSSLIIAIDLRRHRQSMRIMNSVWTLTGLWASIFGLWAYYAFGRAVKSQKPTPGSEKNATKTEMEAMPGMKMDHMEMPGMNMADIEMAGAESDMDSDMDMAMDMGPQRPKWQSVTLSTLHCGAGCTLADLIGEWFLFLVPIAIGGSLLAGSWAFDYVLALVIGIAFQYAAIRGMEHIAPGRAIARAAKADFLSLSAWQLGMYGWMAIVIFGFGDGAQPPRDSFYFWFMMQIAMACGFLVAWPVNALLIRLGIKKAM